MTSQNAISKKIQEAIENLNLTELFALVFKSEKTLRTDLSVLEEKMKALCEKVNEPLPEEFFTVQVPVEKVREAMEILGNMIPKKSRKQNGESTESGKLTSVLSHLATAKREGKSEFSTKYYDNGKSFPILPGSSKEGEVKRTQEEQEAFDFLKNALNEARKTEKGIVDKQEADNPEVKTEAEGDMK